MRYSFLIDTYETERLKVLGVWNQFPDEDLTIRPRQGDPRGRNLLEHMIHQCMSEDAWFKSMFGIDVGAPPLATLETRVAFVERYSTDSAARLAALNEKTDEWWETETAFFDQRRSRAWIMVRRIAHTAHHRGQQMTLLRMLGCDLHSNYGPTADTGGLAKNGATVVYFPGALPGTGNLPSTERP